MDVLTFGETMVAFSTSKNDSIVRSDHTNATIAGAESNVAIALARLGHDVKWFSRLGADPFGEKILYELNAEGIDTKDVIIDSENATGLMFKQKNGLLNSEVIYYRNQSAATKMSIEDIQPEWIKAAEIIHLTGITPSISDSCKQMVFEVLSLAKRHNTLISFDPNVRLKLWDVEEAKELLLLIIKTCDFFFPGRDEMKLLFGVESINEIRKVLQGLEVPLTVLKDGAKGAWLMEQDGCIFIPSFKVDYVADEIGAGDAFAAGFLHGYIQANVDKETCVKLGHALAAFVISTEGDTKGLPNKRELERFWNKDLTTIR